ncbi:SA1362 family protein [Alkalibacillus haloalkaliphilus]|uniref:SA1362 family protein n=1 Tax=Alkalibacillus haloalkaliphilus TaxID=94136 RepID=UPI00293617A4|nr:SA1362 family protein [Alkalibacillus haloalkaliphilus]MDV2580964.1 SA1362 family protein [Alkalibacillus haloalkaliphilus]
MPKGKGAVLLYVIGGLAVIGVFGQLVMNPLGFLQSILMMLGFAALIGALVYYFLIHRRRAQVVGSGYKKAVKQSKQKYGTVDRGMRYSSHIEKPNKINRRRTQRSHLKVIKGNKK